MSTRVFAKIKQEILTWARESGGFSISEAARCIGKSELTILSWESGVTSPTIPQLRDLAQLYKRPLAVFYLQEIPSRFQVLTDFRRLPGNDIGVFSPELTYEIRVAHQRRELAVEMFEELGDEVRPFELRLAIGMDPDVAGTKVREYMGISLQDFNKYRGDATGRKGFNWWRERVENVGVLVFQATRIASAEASGFAMAYGTLPAIVVNRKDAPVRRLFSLLHEFVHLTIDKSGVSDLDSDAIRAPEESAIEIFCNRVAASILMPRSLFTEEAVVIDHGTSTEWDDIEIGTLAKRYNLSREAILRRILTFNRTTPAFYQIKRSEYAEEFRLQKLRELETQVKRSISRNMPQEALSNFGRPFIGLIFDSYRQDRLTLSDVSGRLGLRTHHVAQLQTKIEAT